MAWKMENPQLIFNDRLIDWLIDWLRRRSNVYAPEPTERAPHRLPEHQGRYRHGQQAGVRGEVRQSAQVQVDPKSIENM